MRALGKSPVKAPPAPGVMVAGGRIAFAAALAVIWSIAASVAGPRYVAAPSDVAVRLIDGLRSDTVWSQVLATVRVAGIGFAAGGLAGSVLPLLLWPMPRLVALIEPIVVASAGIPKYAIVPMLILWLGIDNGPKVWLVGLLTFYPLFVGVLAGARNVDRAMLNVARVFGARGFAVARFVMWPAMLPFVFVALRITVPRAVSAAIVGELLVGSEGVGYMIESARHSLDIVGVFAGLVIAVALVLVSAAIVLWAEDRALVRRPIET